MSDLSKSSQMRALVLAARAGQQRNAGQVSCLAHVLSVRVGPIAVVIVALGAGRAAAAPPKLTDADVAPCKLAATWKDKGPTKLEPSEEPSGGRAFQTFECGDKWPVDIDWLDYGSPAEVEWQAAWFRHRWWSDADPDYTSIVRVMIKGPLLAIVVGAHPARMLDVLAKRGWTHTNGVFPRHALAEPTDADVRRWKGRLKCGEPAEPGLERMHEQYARYCSALDGFATGGAPGTARAALATALRTRDPAELLAWVRAGKDDASFGTFLPSSEDDGYKARVLLYALQTGQKTGHDELADELLRRAAHKGQAPKLLGKTLAFELADRFVYVRKTAKGLVVVSQSIAAGWDLVIAVVGS